MAKRYAVFTTLLTPNVPHQTQIDGKDQGLDTDMTDTLPLQIGWDDRIHCQHLRESEEDMKDLPSKGSHGPMEEVMNKLKVVLKRRVEQVVADEDSCKEAMKICMSILDEVDPKSLSAGSLRILLRFLTLYALYKLKQSCRSGSLAKAFEPLLITDEMREIAAKAGIKLQLKATYDTEKFEEVEVFFINRDGGGIQPVKFDSFDVQAETLENMTLDSDGAVVTENVTIQMKQNGSETGRKGADERDPQQRSYVAPLSRE
ncbi:uncharacterized protein [Ptychodera flava]|uniref:uncharacterized protein n=1 Tax=Ptychodera flava TaxID=63121 RepID=UPI003969F36F